MAESQIGAQLFTVRNFTRSLDGVKKTFDRIAAIGYRAAQVSAMEHIDVHAIAKAAQDNNIAIVASHIDWRRFNSDLQAVIEEHKVWDCVHPGIGGLPDEYRSVEGLNRFIDELLPIVETLSAEGMDFSYHNHSHELVRFGGMTWLEQLFQKTPRAFKAEIDTYWIQRGGGDPAEWIEKVSGRIPLLHVKDMRMSMQGEQQYAEIGEGNLNWRAIIREARAAGVRWYLVEQDDCYNRDPFESLAISFRNLRSMGLH